MTTDKQPEKIHHFCYEPSLSKMLDAFDCVRIACPHCRALFWLEADEWGRIRRAAHCCRTGSWEMLPR